MKEALSISIGKGANLRFNRSRLQLAGWTIGLTFGLGACRGEVPPSPPAFFFVDHVRSSETTFTRVELPSLRDEGYLAAPVTLGNDTRICLTSPIPSRQSFSVDLPSQPVIRFAIASATSTRIRDRSPVLFRILLKDGDGEKTVFREVVRREQRDRWLDREVTLDSRGGLTAQLTFETKLLDSRSVTSGEARNLIPLWGNPVLAGGPSSDKTCNIILISIDCLRADHVGVYGYHRATTPHIDRFADDGVVFETAISTAGSTLPTHMSVFTGLPPSFHSASHWQELSRSVPYFPELLGEAYYQVDAVVSGAYLSQHFGFHRGFHTYRYLSRSPAAKTVDAALDILRRAVGQNHFLFLHLIDAHWPYEPPPEIPERIRAGKPDVTYLLNKVVDGEPPDDREEIEQIVDLYDAEIAYADRELGRFFDQLKRMGLYDRSLVVLMADHGEAFFEHGRWQHTITLYEEIVRIPLIVKWPGNSVTGRVKAPVSQVNILPTILEEAGIDFRPWKVAGLRRLVLGERGQPSGREAVSLVSECVTASTSEAGAIKKVSFRTDQIKYIATFRTTPESKLMVHEILDEELYDLTADPGEMRNLLEGSPNDAEPYRRQLGNYLGEAREFEAGRKGEAVILDETIREELQSLGYAIPQ